MQQQQENIQIPNAKMIKTNDLPMTGIHYTADGYVAIGERFAETIKTIDNSVSSRQDVSSTEPAESTGR